MDSRRDFLKKAALLSGSFSNVIPMSIQKALAINADPGTTFYDAEHVVFLMQENRSFDHFFGTLKGVRGFNDPRIKTTPDGNKAWMQKDEHGQAYAPFHVDINKTKVTWQGGLPHSWNDQVAARNNGKYDRWVPVKSLMTLGYYKRSDVPFYYALADAFTICDHHFCSSLTGTTPNRLFFWTGTIRPEQRAEALPVVNNSQAESRDDVFVDWETFPELLENHGIAWKVYQNELWTSVLPEGEIDDWLGNYGDNPLEYVKRHHVKLSAYFRKNGDQTSKPALTVEEVLRQYNKLSPREKNMVDKAFVTNIEDPDYLKLSPYVYTDEQGKKEALNVPKSDIFGQFRKDVDGGNLPTVSWLVAPQRFSDHTSSPLYGTWYVSEALDILTKNPEVWKKTIFILTYDENDGYFDHLPPFVPPKPDDESSGRVSPGLTAWADYEFKKNSPIGLGYRVPMLVASPWSKGGFVNSQVFDHTSSLMFLENFLSHKTGKPVRSSNISSWRRAICGDLTSVFQAYHGEKTDAPSPLKRNAVIGAIQKMKSKPPQATPKPLKQLDIEKINRILPFQKNASLYSAVQEKGVRPACPLPYRHFVDAKVSDDRRSIVLNFSAEKTLFGQKNPTVGVPFNVYTPTKYKGDAGRTWAYAVAAGDNLNDEWNLHLFENELYDLVVNGPNGFHRHFKGSKEDLKIALNVRDELTGLVKRASGNLQLEIANKENSAIKVVIAEDIYRKESKSISLAPQSSRVIPMNLAKSSNWYDFTVRVEGDSNFFRHYAGHVETGQQSISDPFMGGML